MQFVEGVLQFVYFLQSELGFLFDDLFCLFPEEVGLHVVLLLLDNQPALQLLYVCLKPVYLLVVRGHQLVLQLLYLYLVRGLGHLLVVLQRCILLEGDVNLLHYLLFLRHELVVRHVQLLDALRLDLLYLLVRLVLKDEQLVQKLEEEQIQRLLQVLRPNS